MNIIQENWKSHKYQIIDISTIKDISKNTEDIGFVEEVKIIESENEIMKNIINTIEFYQLVVFRKNQQIIHVYEKGYAKKCLFIDCDYIKNNIMERICDYLRIHYGAGDINEISNNLNKNKYRIDDLSNTINPDSYEDISIINSN